MSGGVYIYVLGVSVRGYMSGGGGVFSCIIFVNSKT